MKVTTCCGCISLHDGTIIIGVLGIIGSFLSLIHLSNGRAVWNDRGKSNHHDIDPTTTRIIQIISVVIGLIINALLIIGAQKKNATMMIPALVTNAMGLVFLTILTTIAFVYFNVMVGFFMIFVTTLLVYFWLIIYNYFKEVKLEERT